MFGKKKWLKKVGARSIDEVIDLEATHRVDSLVCAIESALMDTAHPTPAERVVLAVEAMEREVNNGGFMQFFNNSSNEFAFELAPALKQIGAPQAADIAARALAIIGAEPGWSYDDFESATVESDEATEEALNACDDAYYGNDEAIGELLFEFIRANRADIHLGSS